MHTSILETARNLIELGLLDVTSNLTLAHDAASRDYHDTDACRLDEAARCLEDAIPTGNVADQAARLVSLGLVEALECQGSPRLRREAKRLARALA